MAAGLEVATLFVSVALAWAASTLIVEFAERLAAAYDGPLGRHLGNPGAPPHATEGTRCSRSSRRASSTFCV